ncbi:MAG TPA: hypothetical protein VMM56_06510 [Planctomycetaceae bacterium]|nr:hypothetical protein [Planctomycetaceae bacterium]
MKGSRFKGEYGPDRIPENSASLRLCARIRFGIQAAKWYRSFGPLALEAFLPPDLTVGPVSFRRFTAGWRFSQIWKIDFVEQVCNLLGELCRRSPLIVFADLEINVTTTRNVD